MKNQPPVPDEAKLMAAIRTGGPHRESAWEEITRNWGAYILNTTVKTCNCSPEEAREAYSVAVVGIDRRIRSGAPEDFLQKASFKTYLTKSTRYAALKIKGNRIHDDDPENYAGKLASEDLEQYFERRECREVMKKALSGIGERCKIILLLFNDGYSMEEIAREMGFKAETNAKNEKYKCQEKFKSYLTQNPDIKKSLTDSCHG